MDATGKGTKSTGEMVVFYGFYVVRWILDGFYGNFMVIYGGFREFFYGFDTDVPDDFDVELPRSSMVAKVLVDGGW